MSRNVNTGNKADQPVVFRLQDSQRIAKVVRAYEADPRQAKPSKLPRAAGGGGGGGVQAGFFSGAWPKNGYKTVSLAVDTAQTVTVYNPIASIPDRGQRRVIFTSLSIETGQTTFSSLNFVTCEC